MHLIKFARERAGLIGEVLKNFRRQKLYGCYEKTLLRGGRSILTGLRGTRLSDVSWAFPWALSFPSKAARMHRNRHLPRTLYGPHLADRLQFPHAFDAAV
jgi:hypothetical protein